jgi:3alpha(or 20beta)-hydroxysteroid dehydrogenase
MGRVDGKVIVVTGAAHGLGAAQVAWLTREGATVIATDIAFEDGTAADGTVQRHHDVGAEDDWHDVARFIGKQHGVVHGLVNNAGIPFRDGLLEIKVADWDRVFRINVTGQLLGIQALVPLMTNGGSIVNISSLAGLSAMPFPAYTASKWAVRGLSRVASLELGPRGIRVNTVFPGSIDTPLTRTSAPAFRQAMLDEIPLGRQGSGDDLAPMVGFLISDEASWVSGAEISVDGGEWSHGGTKLISEALRSDADQP